MIFKNDVDLWTVDVMYDTDDCAGQSVFTYYCSDIDMALSELRCWVNMNLEDYHSKRMYFEIYKSPLS